MTHAQPCPCRNCAALEIFTAKHFTISLPSAVMNAMTDKQMDDLNEAVETAFDNAAEAIGCINDNFKIEVEDL